MTREPSSVSFRVMQVGKFFPGHRKAICGDFFHSASKCHLRRFLLQCAAMPFEEVSSKVRHNVASKRAYAKIKKHSLLKHNIYSRHGQQEILQYNYTKRNSKAKLNFVDFPKCVYLYFTRISRELKLYLSFSAAIM